MTRSRPRAATCAPGCPTTRPGFSAEAQRTKDESEQDGAGSYRGILRFSSGSDSRAIGFPDRIFKSGSILRIFHFGRTRHRTTFRECSIFKCLRPCEIPTPPSWWSDARCCGRGDKRGGRPFGLRRGGDPLRMLDQGDANRRERHREMRQLRFGRAYVLPLFRLQAHRTEFDGLPILQLTLGHVVEAVLASRVEHPC